MSKEAQIQDLRDRLVKYKARLDVFLKEEIITQDSYNFMIKDMYVEYRICRRLLKEERRYE